MTARDAHLHALEMARATHSLRTVIGYQYPVPEGEFMRWQEQRKELARAKARAFLATVEPAYRARQAFV